MRTVFFLLMLVAVIFPYHGASMDFRLEKALPSTGFFSLVADGGVLGRAYLELLNRSGQITNEVVLGFLLGYTTDEVANLKECALCGHILPVKGATEEAGVLVLEFSDIKKAIKSWERKGLVVKSNGKDRLELVFKPKEEAVPPGSGKKSPKEAGAKKPLHLYGQLEGNRCYFVPEREELLEPWLSLIRRVASDRSAQLCSQEAFLAAKKDFPGSGCLSVIMPGRKNSAVPENQPVKHAYFAAGIDAGELLTDFRIQFNYAALDQMKALPFVNVLNALVKKKNPLRGVAPAQASVVLAGNLDLAMIPIPPQAAGMCEGLLGVSLERDILPCFAESFCLSVVPKKGGAPEVLLTWETAKDSVWGVLEKLVSRIPVPGLEIKEEVFQDVKLKVINVPSPTAPRIAVLERSRKLHISNSPELIVSALTAEGAASSKQPALTDDNVLEFFISTKAVEQIGVKQAAPLLKQLPDNLRQGQVIFPTLVITVDEITKDLLIKGRMRGGR
ncbi:MAG: hypothetical protein PHQ23_06060 [Candidatus Wallbacteria bacterium]|nr:hypothetical protein [Candidatus Wallbacteria bacterium]